MVLSILRLYSMYVCTFIRGAPNTVWLVIFVRDYSCVFFGGGGELRVICELKLRNVRCPHAKWAKRISNRLSSNYLAILIPTETCQRVCLRRLSLKQSRKSKYYVSTDARSGRWCKAESRSNPFYKCPGYEATLLTTLEPRAEMAISLCKQFLTFTQLLAVLLANACRSQIYWPQKFKPQKFLKSEFWPVSWKFLPAKITIRYIVWCQRLYMWGSYCCLFLLVGMHLEQVGAYKGDWEGKFRGL